MEEFAKEYEEDGRLFKLQFEKEIPARKFCIVLNERIPMSAAAAKLLPFEYPPSFSMLFLFTY